MIRKSDQGNAYSDALLLCYSEKTLQTDAHAAQEENISNERSCDGDIPGLNVIDPDDDVGDSIVSAGVVLQKEIRGLQTASRCEASIIDEAGGRVQGAEEIMGAEIVCDPEPTDGRWHAHLAYLGTQDEDPW